MPAYNEQENIETVINQWYSVVESISMESRLVIVDDGSTDDTYVIMQKCAQGKPQFIPITKKNSGHGATVLYAYRYAITEGADYIFQTDSDGQTIPEEFMGRDFWEQRSSYDMIIGHRNKREDGYSRIFVTKILKLVIRMCFGVNVTDANTPFRLMNAQVLKENIAFIPEDYFLSNVIISVLYAKKNLAVKYVPISFRPRCKGKNSINFRKIVSIGFHAVNDFRKINKTINEGDN